MKLMTWNVGLVGNLFRKVMCVFEKKEISIKNICNRIIKENPDIVALQEIYGNDFELIQDELKELYPYRIHKSSLGLCFLSKPKLTYEYKIIFPRDKLSSCLRTHNGVIVAREENTRNFFCNAHLSCGLGYEYEYHYINTVRKVHKNDNLIMCGDFNAFRNYNYSKICKLLEIKKNNENKYYSYDHPLLKCNFDYIINFDKGEEKGYELGSKCIDDKSSDHYPLISEILNNNKRK